MSLTIRFGTPARRWVPLDSRIRAAIRMCLADEIERLLGILDSFDPDPDLEDGGDCEPYLASTPRDARSSTEDDREEDASDEPEGIDDDREPALGWTLDGEVGSQGSYLHQEDEPSLGWLGHGAGWSGQERDAGTDEREDDAGDHGEFDEDREPFLGWTPSVDQSSPQRLGDAWRWEDEEA